jgi:uncharacterized protein DUF6941
MARIDWTVLCDLAFFDRQDRLCIVGIVRALPTPGLPVCIKQIMLVAHLTDLQQSEEIEVAVSIATPSGLVSTARDPECVVMEVAFEYILVTLRDIPLTEEGIYQFRLALSGESMVSVSIPVLASEVASRMAH